MSQVHGPVDSRVVPKSWSSGRILTETQRHQKRNKDRINKERRRKKDEREKKEFRSKLHALEQQLYNPLAVNSPNPLVGKCKCDQTSEQSYCMECGLAVCYPLKNDRSYVLKNNGDQLLGQVHYLTPSQVCLNESINQDTLIRGILFGWGNLRNGNFWCPLWEIIYQIDTSLFSQTGFLTRICMLRTIHLLLQCFMQTSGFRDIPTWYRPRPSQLMFHHDISADYFAWPGLRERLVLTGSQILTDEFFGNFAASFRFIWPHGLSDVYHIDAITGLHSLSSLFKESHRDIRNWTMDQRFFDAFPEVYYDLTLST